MGFPAGFPFYFDGKHHVSLAFPPMGNKPSEISKVAGITASYPLLLPNIDFLQEFVKGDIGIAKKMIQEALFKNFNHPIAASNPQVFKAFAKVADSEIDDINKYKSGDKFKMPKSAVKIPKQEGIGFNGLEKTILTSIFETQKPYMEIAKIVIGTIAKIEDIVARIMPLLSPNPLTAKSQKPVGNNGVPNGRPKAIGYKSGDELKKSLAKLQGIANKGKKVNIDKDGKASRDTPSPNGSPSGTASAADTGNTSEAPNNTEASTGFPLWQILSVVYTTGIFIPGINYNYTYIDLPAEEEAKDSPEDLGLDDDGDPYKKFKPKNLIFGIFDSTGSPLNPTEKLSTISINQQGLATPVPTQFSKADWILQSPKWKFPSGVYTWPQYGPPIYTWEGTLVNIGQERNSKTKPDPTKDISNNIIGDWKKKKYKEGEKNLLNGLDAIANDPVIVGFESTEVSEYQRFMTDLVKFRMHFADGLEQSEKDAYSTQILTPLNIPSQLENINLYGQAKSSIYKNLPDGSPAIPEDLKKSFKPFEIFSAEAAADPKIKEYANKYGKQPGFIWIDPESDYDLKVIRVDPTTNIEYETAQSQPEIGVQIKSFIKNKLTFKIDDNRLFGIEITKNGISQVFEDIDSYVLDNWNYISDPGVAPQNRVVSTNTYKVSIWSKVPTRKYENLASEIKLTNSDETDYSHVVQKIGDKFFYKRQQPGIVDAARVEIFVNLTGIPQLTLLSELAQRSLTNQFAQYSITFTGDKLVRNKIGTGDAGDLEFYIPIDNYLTFVPSLSSTRTISEVDSFGATKTLTGNIISLVDQYNNLASQSEADRNLRISLGNQIKNLSYDYSESIKTLLNNGSVSVPNGILSLPDEFKTKVFIQNDEIIRWYYLNDLNLPSPFPLSNPPPYAPLTNDEITYLTRFTLPVFGQEATVTLNTNLDPITVSGTASDARAGNLPVLSRVVTNIPLYTLKITNSNFPYGKIIDPSKITNDILRNQQELFSTGKYGHGDPEDPQELGLLKRFMLTDLDTESYYIIEGVLVEENTQTGQGGSSGGQGQAGAGSGAGAGGGGDYRLPHAVGAIKVFVSMLVDVFSKLIPAIVKLIKLFKGPAEFVTEILKEKMGEGFSIFSKDSFKAFEKAAKISKKAVPGGNMPNIKDGKNDPTGAANNLEAGAPKPSAKVKEAQESLKNSPLWNHVFVDAKGKIKFLPDGVALLPFELFGKKITFGLELNFSGIPDSKPPIKLIFDADLANSDVKNMQQFLKPSLKDYKGPGADGVSAPITVSDLRDSSTGEPLDTKSPGEGIRNPNNSGDLYEIISVEYSTGQFINGIDYRYIYITLEDEKLLKEIDDFVASNPSELLSGDASALLFDKLDEAIKRDPNNEALKDKKKELKKKLAGLNESSQPLLKMLLGIVTLPIKIIAGIIEWIMEFFKKLTNPMTLPAAMAEFLSFQWVLKFFTPKGLLELAGVKFKPELIAEWLSKATVPNPKPPTGGNNSRVSNIDSDVPEELEFKDATPKGRHAIPDDFKLANLDEFLSMPFMPKLPTYTARQLREMPDRPFKLFWPFICFLEKIINGIIDFVWSTLGIEAIIPPPHVKFCSKSKDPGQMDADEIVKLLNGDNLGTPEPKFKVNPKTGELEPVNEPQANGDALDSFVYDITLPDGSVKRDLNYEELQKFIAENEDIEYNFQF